MTTADHFYDRTITTTELSEYLGVHFQTLNTWFNKNVLLYSHSNPGRGRRRRFALEDVVAARIARQLLAVTKSFDVARAAVKTFRLGIDPSSGMERPSLSISIRETGEIYSGWVRRDADEDWAKEGGYKSQSLGLTILAVRVFDIVDEVKAAFPKLAEE